jgi:formamidopyrimidine-DNA glycosylase
MKLADLLLDQTFVAGIGNKYKSEILFLRKLWPFRIANNLSWLEEQQLLEEIPRVLKIGYVSAGRTRPQQQEEASNKWEFRHWVFEGEDIHVGYVVQRLSLIGNQVLV